MKSMDVKCCACSEEKPMRTDSIKRTLLPAGWVEFNGVHCRKCWSKKFTVRAVTFPVVKPLGVEWPEFGKALRQAWQDVTSLANITVQELFRADVVRTPDMEKLPPAPKVNVYKIGRERFPKMDSVVVAAVVRAVQSKYNRERWGVIWQRNTALPVFNSPQPLPIPARNWRAEMTESGVVVDLPVSGVRYRLALRGGRDYARQTAAVQKVCDGTLKGCQMDLLMKGDSVMVKIALYMEKQSAAVDPEKVLFVSSDPQSILVAHGKETELWRFNGDHVPRWIAEHKKRLQRLSDDNKFEHRTEQNSHLSEAREKLVEKHAARMDTLLHTIARSTVNYSARRGYGKIHLTITDAHFPHGFPLYKLAHLIAEKSAQVGIQFDHDSGEEKAA